MRANTLIHMLTGFSFLAILAIAGTASAQTVPTVPICTPPVQGFVPHVYEGKIESFDYFYTATGTPVLVKTVVDGSEIEPRYSSIWVVGSATKVHVDVPSWYPVSGNVPIKVTVATPTGCVETYTFNLELPVTSVTPIAAYGENTAPAAYRSTTNTTNAPYITGKGGPASNTPVTSQTGATGAAASIKAECTPDEVLLSWEPQAGAQSYVIEKKASDGVFAAIKILPKRDLAFSDVDVEGAAVYTYRVRGFDGIRFVGVSDEATCGVPVDKAGGTIAPALENTVCTSWIPAVWTALIIVQLILSLVTIDMLHKLLVGNGWRLSAALFVPFAALLALWFVFDGCRSYQWFPIAVTLITLFTLFAPVIFRKKVSLAE